MGASARRYVENRLRAIENRPIKFDRSGTGVAPPNAQPGKWEIKEARKYNKDADGLKGDEPAAADIPLPSSLKKEKKPLIEEVNGAAAEDSEEEEDDDDDSDDDMVDAPATNGVNGKKLSAKEEKALQKAEKAARKAARAEKRRSKEEKRAKKEAKNAEKDKKRKRESDGNEVVKKGKKKSKSS
jgi:nucleolar protein 58